MNFGNEYEGSVLSDGDFHIDVLCSVVVSVLNKKMMIYGFTALFQCIFISLQLQITGNYTFKVDHHLFGKVQIRDE